MPTKIRILLADDHAIVRQGIRRIVESDPELAVVAEASSGIEAIEMTVAHKPDVVVMDIGMRDLNGIEATAQLLRKCPRTAVLILSMFNDERYVVRAVKSGARGYLIKDTVEEELLEGIRGVHIGQSYFSPSIAKVLLDGYARELNAQNVEDRYELLTERERQVYQMLAEGSSNKEVAARLKLSLHTIETHRVRIMEKLDVHSAAELVLSAVRRGLVH